MTGVPYKSSFRVTSPYGMRIDPISGGGTWHGGIDLVGEGDDKTVVSTSQGVVVQSQIITDRADLTWEWGNYVAVLADNGYVIYYCHLSRRLVKVGDAVKVGTPLGIEGSSGRSTGSHLHFEVRKNGTQTDPSVYIGIGNTEGYTFIPDVTAAKTDSTPSTWATEGIKWATENRILLGNSEGDLMLRSPCTREEVAVMLYRMYMLIKG